MTFCVFETAAKFVVAAVLTFTTQTPAPPELNVPVVAVALTKEQGPPVVLERDRAVGVCGRARL